MPDTYEEKRKVAVEALKYFDYFVLECAYNLLRKPRAWKKGGLAFKKYREYNEEDGFYDFVDETDVNDPEAFAFCLVGAIQKCDKNAEFFIPDEGAEFDRDLSEEIIEFNDFIYTNKNKVLRAIKTAMKAKENEKKGRS